jgi:hypothetical protein
MCFLSWPQFPSKRLSCFQAPWFPATQTTAMTHDSWTTQFLMQAHLRPDQLLLIKAVINPPPISFSPKSCMYSHPPQCCSKKVHSQKNFILFTLSHVKQYDFSFIPRATPPLNSTSNFGWRKVKTCQFDSANWFCLSIFTHDSEAGKKTQQSLNPKHKMIVVFWWQMPTTCGVCPAQKFQEGENGWGKGENSFFVRNNFASYR